MALIIREGIKQYNYIFYELSDPRVHYLPLMTSPLPIVLIVASYIYFSTSLGPRLMCHRPAFKLDTLVQVYDVVQIAMSLWLVKRSLELGWAGKYNWFCEPVNYSPEAEPLAVALTCYTYFIVKVIDLLDTVFFVLRKKNTQITFLHVYHHAAMALGIWGATKYIAGGHGTFLGFVNSIVHAVMYSYYLVTSLYPQYKNNIWWKKHITQLQMLQFLMITLHALQLLVQPNCNYPKTVVFILVPQNAFMLLMFYDFYRKAYSPKKAAAQAPPPKMAAAQAPSPKMAAQIDGVKKGEDSRKAEEHRL